MEVRLVLVNDLHDGLQQVRSGHIVVGHQVDKKVYVPELPRGNEGQKFSKLLHVLGWHLLLEKIKNLLSTKKFLSVEQPNLSIKSLSEPKNCLLRLVHDFCVLLDEILIREDNFALHDVVDFAENSDALGRRR